MIVLSRPNHKGSDDSSSREEPEELDTDEDEQSGSQGEGEIDEEDGVGNGGHGYPDGDRSDSTMVGADEVPWTPPMFTLLVAFGL